MNAAVLADDGIAIQQVPLPSPGPSEVLVRVRTGGLNRADVMVASGHHYSKSMSGSGTVLGFECAGVVADLGTEARKHGGFQIGDRVMCGGVACWAEYAVADWGWTDKIPAGMSWGEAASFSSALYTMHNAIVSVGGMRAGHRVLVQGASSGVGLMAMQIAKLKGASLVVGTSSDPERRAKLVEFGADMAVDACDPLWPDRVLAATGGEGVDLVIDNVSGATVNGSLRATKVCGRIVNVGRLGGTTADFDFDLHARRRIEYVGVTFRTRSTDEVRAIGREMRADIGSAWEQGKLRMPLDRTFPFAATAEALAYMQANRHFGKIVLEISRDAPTEEKRGEGSKRKRDGNAVGAPPEPQPAAQRPRLKLSPRSELMRAGDMGEGASQWAGLGVSVQRKKARCAECTRPLTDSDADVPLCSRCKVSS